MPLPAFPQPQKQPALPQPQKQPALPQLRKQPAPASGNNQNSQSCPQKELNFPPVKGLRMEIFEENTIRPFTGNRKIYWPVGG